MMADSFFKNETSETPSGGIPNLHESTAESVEKSEEAQQGFQTEEGRLAAILSYIPLLCFIPLLNMKDNKEARLHARQGVILFLIELVAVLFLVDGISDFVFKGILIVAVALSVVGIYFALQGKSYKLPIISDLADKTKL
jgi:fumarate reductase subunit D